ncbi:MAG: F0F1 ATP synthase subunit B [Alphaproteobacteria bacterium]|jgi:F-type H+-transporting ATPase subunit b|nr:F0F1 ATP synthase subunit B [Alphaproteobacteria bacterium]
MAETTHASTEAAGGAVEHASPAALGMDATMWVALAMLIVIAIALWQRVPGMIAAALDKKIDGIREHIEAAENLRKEAEALKADYQKKAKAAAKDAEAMKAAAAEEAKQIVAKAKADASALIARRTQTAEEKIAAAERAAVADVRNRAAQVAAAAAAQLIAKGHDGKADKALIDQTISSLN